MQLRTPAVFLPILFLAGACSDDGDAPSSEPNASGGAATSGGSASGGAPSGSGGMVSSGGVPASSGGTPPASGGAETASGGSGSGGAEPAAGGSGEDASGGRGDGGGLIEGTGGMDGGEMMGDVKPSPGCSKGTPRPEGGRDHEAGVSWIIFPEKYDGTTPLPVLWGWHGCGGYNWGDDNRTEYWDETRNSAFATDYVVVAPLSASGSGNGCFNYGQDIVRTKALYDKLTENYCVDLDHMFGTGHSSGASFLHDMLLPGREADWEYLSLRGIAPVASGPKGDVASQVPVMYIHSPGESVSAEDSFVSFRNGNGCQMSSTPYAMVDSCNSSGGQMVDSACEVFDGCDVTTIFCPHNDPDYDGTHHGIPCFFQQAAHDFFMSL